MEHSSRYIVLFAAAVCAVCSIIVSGAAVGLKERQERNKKLDVQEKVLVLAGLAEVGALSDDAIESTYASSIEPHIVNLTNGQYVEDVDAAEFDFQEAMGNPKTSREAPTNAAQVRRVPENGIVYQVKGKSGAVEQVILPIQGKGLWSTLYGFISLGQDANTIQGITFYDHGETPGLGGEVDNPRWKSLWKGRKAFGPRGDVAIKVKKGQAGPPASDPYQVDGLSGATITSRGVTDTLQFWLGDDAFGPYLNAFRQGGK